LSTAENSDAWAKEDVGILGRAEVIPHARNVLAEILQVGAGVRSESVEVAPE
jgi:hypothetical protein